MVTTDIATWKALLEESRDLWERIPAYDRRIGWGQGANLQAWRNLSTGERLLIDMDNAQFQSFVLAEDEEA
jgi:hypothetical protein